MGTNGNKPKVKKISYLIMEEKKEKEKKKDIKKSSLIMPYHYHTT